MKTINNFIIEKLQKINSKNSQSQYIINTYTIKEFIKYINEYCDFEHFAITDIRNRYYEAYNKKMVFNLIDGDDINDIAKKEFEFIKKIRNNPFEIYNYIRKLKNEKLILYFGTDASYENLRILYKFKKDNINYVFVFNYWKDKYQVFKITI